MKCLHVFLSFFIPGWNFIDRDDFIRGRVSTRDEISRVNTLLVRSEFSLLDSQALVVTKLPDISIRNDKDVKGLKSGGQVSFSIVNHQNTITFEY